MPQCLPLFLNDKGHHMATSICCLSASLIIIIFFFFANPNIFIHLPLLLSMFPHLLISETYCEAFFSWGNAWQAETF